MSEILRFDSVSFQIDGRSILDSLSFSLNEGETLVLLGRSGSGKTTALRLVNALLYPTSGRVFVQGKATAEWDPIRLRRGIGYVIQDVGLLPHRSVIDNVGLVPTLESWEQARIASRGRELLGQVGLDPSIYAARYPRELSGGQRQRVGIARALAADPPLLLFDEPFGALDPITRLDLQNQFLELRNQFRKTAVFVTHDIQEAMRLGTRIGVLFEGRLEQLLSPDEFFRSATGEAARFLACLPDGKSE